MIIYGYYKKIRIKIQRRQRVHVSIYAFPSYAEDAGIQESHIRQMLVDNPQRIFFIKKETEKDGKRKTEAVIGAAKKNLSGDTKSIQNSGKSVPFGDQCLSNWGTCLLGVKDHKSIRSTL